MNLIWIIDVKQKMMIVKILLKKMKSAIILMLLYASCIMAKPLNKNFQCKEVEEELKLFRGLMANSSSSHFVDSVFNYFNLSQVYIQPFKEEMKKKFKCKFSS